MTAAEQLALRRLAEQFRTRAGLVEGKHGKLVWVQAINVMEAFNQCAEHLETFLHETLETGPQEPAPAQAPLCAVPSPQTTNPS